MDLPLLLQEKIIKYIASLPNVHDSDSQRVLIYHAGFDEQLQAQLPFGKSASQFAALLVSTLTRYGCLRDGQHALEALLEATKQYIGHDRAEYCETLIQEVHAHISIVTDEKRENQNKDDVSPPVHRVQQRKSIAIVCPLFGASRIYYTELLDAVINQASERGYEVLIVPITDTTFKRALSSHFPQISSIAGIILITCQVQNSTWLEECASKKLPVVLLHDNITQRNAQGYSVVSHIQPRLNALSEAIRHLVVKHSCRNISVVMVNPEKHRIREEKLFLIERAIREMELPFERERQLYYVKNYSHKQGLLVTNRIVENNPDTDAIICLADLAAIGVMHRLTELNLHKHIRVTGFDNVEFALQNDLTTIDQELKITGERALTDLHTAIQSGSISEFQTISEIPTTFVPRGSCCFL